MDFLFHSCCKKTPLNTKQNEMNMKSRKILYDVIIGINKQSIDQCLRTLKEEFEASIVIAS